MTCFEYELWLYTVLGHDRGASLPALDYPRSYKSVKIDAIFMQSSLIVES